MKESTPIQTLSIRFKRWSRKSYSIFCSLKRVVSIGVLSNYIADASCKKSDVYAFTEINNRFSETVDEEEKDVLRLLKELFLTQNVALALSDASPSREKYTVESYNSAGNGYAGYLFSAFFVLIFCIVAKDNLAPFQGFVLIDVFFVGRCPTLYSDRLSAYDAKNEI